MAGLRGNRGKIVFSASGVVAQVTQWSVEESGDTIEDTAMDPAASDGPIAKTFLAGNTEWTMSLTCNTDRSDTDGQAAMRGGSSATLKVYPTGDASGQKYWTGTVIVTRVSEQGEVNGKITWSAQVKGTGALSFTTA